MYTENYKTAMKEVEDTQINGKIPQIHGSEELIMLKCSLYPKQPEDSI